jgi:hypothetical protein
VRDLPPSVQTIVEMKGDNRLLSHDTIKLSAYLLSMRMYLVRERMIVRQGHCCFIDPQAYSEEETVSHNMTRTQ